MSYSTLDPTYETATFLLYNSIKTAAHSLYISTSWFQNEIFSVHLLGCPYGDKNPECSSLTQAQCALGSNSDVCCERCASFNPGTQIHSCFDHVDNYDIL